MNAEEFARLRQELASAPSRAAAMEVVRRLRQPLSDDQHVETTDIIAELKSRAERAPGR